jgi:O-succinylbenzoic acid--CoA ligase
MVRCYASRPVDVFAMFETAVTRAAGETAAVDGDDRVTYTALAQRVAVCAAAWQRLGLRAGDRAALLLDNRIDFLVALLAAARLGVIAVPLNIRQKRPETAYALNDSGAVLLVYESSLSGELPLTDEVPELHHRLIVDDTTHVWDDGHAGALVDTAPVGEDEPFCILYTSGTTGLPKGAVLTHLGTVSSCMAAHEHLGLQHGETTILCVPASHVTGIILELLLMVRVAGKTVFQRGFKARRFLEEAAAERMSYVIMVPAMYTLCLMDADYDKFGLANWRVGAYGGAPMPDALLEDLARRQRGLALHNIYGATETTSPAVIMPAGEGFSRRTQVGRAVSCCDLLVMDEAGRELPPGEQGEIWMAGPMVIPRYWNNSKATEENFLGGYWKSGDIGTLDQAGYLRVHDRKKDMINRGGFKIYSVEVENALMAHPAVLEAGVIGVPCPVLGERVKAYAVLREPASEAALRNHCAERLSDYKVPDRIVILDQALPRNANGKLLKTALRALDEAVS